MSTVKRYDYALHPTQCIYEMMEAEGGEYVLATDYDTLAAEYAEYRKCGAVESDLREARVQAALEAALRKIFTATLGAAYLYPEIHQLLATPSETP